MPLANATVNTAPAPRSEIQTEILPGSEASPAPMATIKPKAATKPSAVPKAKTTVKKKPALKPRKLCWKDGRLDVCP